MESNNTQQIPNATPSTSSSQLGVSSPTMQQKQNSSPDTHTDNKSILSTQTTRLPSQSTTNVSPTDMGQLDCNILSPTLADILSDDRILRFYQCVKEIKLQQSPQHTSSMFFALCHALGDSVSFLKVPNMNKIMFRQDEQIFAVNIPGTTTVNDTQPSDTTTSTIYFPHMTNPTTTATTTSTDSSASNQYQPPPPQNGNHTTNNNLAAAAAAAANYFSASSQSQQILQAALSSVGPHDSDVPTVPNAVAIPTTTASSTITGVRRRGNADKRSKKPSPRDKEYAIRRNDIIHDLLKVSEADLFHQANTVDNDVKFLIQGQEKNTKLGLSSPLHRFATFANLAAHYDSDFAPKNAGVYYNYEYFQLYVAYRDLEIERSLQEQQANQATSDLTGGPIGSNPAATSPSSVSRPVLMQCRADIEKVLVNTNWEAIRRRLTIGERICQVCGILGRGYLLLSKQVSGRKLLHNFNTGEWGEFLREFQRPETFSLLQNLQAKLSPVRLYQNQPHHHHHQQQQQQQQLHNPPYSQFSSTSATIAAPDPTNNIQPVVSPPPPPPPPSATITTTTTTTQETAKLGNSRQTPTVIPYTSNSPTSSLPSSPAPLDSRTDIKSPSDQTPKEEIEPSTDDLKEEERQYKKAKVEQD